MIDLNMYQAMLQGCSTGGQAKKIQSDIIMESSWNEDIQSKVGYLYDWYHDDEPLRLRNLSSQTSLTKISVDIKYIVDTYQTMDKDQVTYHLQFKPYYESNVSYYEDVFEKRYNSLFPLGLYIDIPDEKGHFNKWLIVDKANYYDSQFVTYQILPCDYVFQYVLEGEKYQIAGCLRSQNSYNSGVWRDYKVESPEDQQKAILPLNRDTEKLFYNQRMIIDAKVLSEPIAWRITKVHRLAPNGLVRLTYAQDRFDQHKDYIEIDKQGDIIGMWADYFRSELKPSEFVPRDKEESVLLNNPKNNISFNGLKPQIKVGGSFKTLTAHFYNSQNLEIANTENCVWTFTVDNEDATNVLEVVNFTSDGNLQNNQIKIRFKDNDDYLGKILVAHCYWNSQTIETCLEIVGL